MFILIKYIIYTYVRKWHLKFVTSISGLVERMGKASIGLIFFSYRVNCLRFYVELDSIFYSA